MTPDQLAHEVINHRVEVEVVIFLPHLAVEDHLKQQITQFIFQVRVVFSVDGIGNLVGLFNGVGHDGLIALAGIPRAPGLRVPKPCHQGFKIVNGIAHDRFRLTLMMLGRLRIWASNLAN